MAKWTVIGFWDGDSPVPVGVVAGDHQVVGGFHPDFQMQYPEGPWATCVDAPTDDEAERLAIEEMAATLDD